METKENNGTYSGIKALEQILDQSKHKAKEISLALCNYTYKEIKAMNQKGALDKLIEKAYIKAIDIHSYVYSKQLLCDVYSQVAQGIKKLINSKQPRSFYGINAVVFSLDTKTMEMVSNAYFVKYASEILLDIIAKCNTVGKKHSLWQLALSHVFVCLFDCLIGVD